MLQASQLLGGFNPLRRDAHAQTVGQLDHRARHSDVNPSARQVGNKAAVNIEHIKRKGLDVGQRGVARAKVINRQTHAQRLELSQQFVAGLQVLVQHTLRDFNHQQLRLQTAGGERVFHKGAKLRRMQM